MRLRCLLGNHETRLVYRDSEAFAACKHCHQMTDGPWPVLRPEALSAKDLVAAEARERAARDRAIVQEREERARRMGRRLSIVRPA